MCRAGTVPAHLVQVDQLSFDRDLAALAHVLLDHLGGFAIGDQIMPLGIFHFVEVKEILLLGNR